jgi:hypothetical protein
MLSQCRLVLPEGASVVTSVVEVAAAITTDGAVNDVTAAAAACAGTLADKAAAACLREYVVRLGLVADAASICAGTAASARAVAPASTL